MKTDTPFTFTADSKLLETSIKKVSAVLSLSAAQAQSYFLASIKKQVWVVGIGSDSFVRVALTGVKASDDGSLSFAPATLLGIIKGRKELVFDYSGQDLAFKQLKGSYKGNLVTMPVTPDQVTTYEARMRRDKSTDAELSEDLMAQIKYGFDATHIRDVFQDSALVALITLTKEGNLTVSSFDSSHFSLYEAQGVSKGIAFRAALPATHFALIDQVSEGTTAKFTFSQTAIRVDGPGFNLALPATQVEEAHYDLVPSFARSLKAPTYRCKTDVADLQAVTDNLYTLYSANTTFVLSTKGSTLNVSFKTPTGSASDSIKVVLNKEWAPAKVSVDPRLFKDLLSLSGVVANLEMAFTDQVLIFRGKTSTGASLFLACSRYE